ncbi:hypothetical protein C5E10_01485 [Pseudoclavibacter sp. RFBG4]|uniref:DUF2834 domain-containing protein n=1 Tax=Pseudoclavibacter sp. RFBG4 TaxID=2080575 RepID=UPI000CE82835|nr:DUF2834 domain-containing protein [Pseudoclavibacter sp. RFBG4]PPG36218.1 hypothetical protein C5E10_01485 [Pseudoclavibacter sp. RFBG4]
MRASTWTPLAIIYLLLAIVGGAVTWTFNVIAGMEGSAFVGDYFGSGPAVTSIMIDVLVAATVGVVFIIVEGRRQGMRRLWVYVLCFGVAFAFALPLFLAMRERHLSSRRAASESGRADEDPSHP